MPLRLSQAFLALLLTVSFVRADILDELSADEKNQLTQGQIVVKSIDVPNSAWPKLQLYEIVNCTPNVLWNLFTDYAAAPSYTPNLISADVLSKNADGSTDVRYTVKVPVIQRATYTVHNTYAKKGNLWTVAWTVTNSPLSKSGEGSLRIQPYGKNQTIMCYTNLVVPLSGLLGGLKGQALSEAKTTVAAIKAEAERRANGGN